MASNCFGTIFRFTTWGESHGLAIGVVIDGCPAGISITVDEINVALAKRAPGSNQYVSPRKEPDRAEICSGIFNNKTTGSPVMIMIKNKAHDSSKYESTKDLLKPGHANFSYLKKYGYFDYNGSGRASGRETASRVVAAVFAEKIIQRYGIEVLGYLDSVGPYCLDSNVLQTENLRQKIAENVIKCPDENVAVSIQELLIQLQQQGDSIGGAVGFYITGVPAGLGDPIYEKLEANLAKAMMTIPASKGFEIGQGFAAINMRGSQHNDSYVDLEHCSSNHAGGILAGISNGMPIYGRVAFKPASSIRIPQDTVNIKGEKAKFVTPPGSKHDCCVAIRAVEVVAAMAKIVLADAILVNNSYRELLLQDKVEVDA